MQLPEPINKELILKFSDFECPLCYHVKINVVCPKTCGHTICNDCYNCLPDKNNCPTCRAEVSDLGWITNHYFQRLITYFKFQCPNFKHGCTNSILTMKNYNTHCMECKFYKFTCTNNSCTWSGDKKDIRHHLLECPYGKIKCFKCCDDFTKMSVATHKCTV